MTHGDAASVERDLERFTERQIRTIPDLALAAASTELLAGRGDLAAHWRSAAVRATPADATPAVLAGLAALRAPRSASKAWSAWSRTPGSPRACFRSTARARRCAASRRAPRITCWATATGPQPS